MDNYKIIVGKYAKKDLIDIYDYISNTLCNNKAAIRLLNKINDKFEEIKIFPKSAPLINNEYVKNKNIRKLLIDNYIAFYEIDEINLEINIIRVIYGMMNYIDILQCKLTNNFNKIFKIIRKDVK